MKNLQPQGVWSNFHSDDNKRQNDYKLRFALMGTHFWGSYITDVIKEPGTLVSGASAVPAP